MRILERLKCLFLLIFIMRKFELILIISVILISGCTQQPTGQAITSSTNERAVEQPQTPQQQTITQYNPCQDITCNDYCSNNLRYYNGYCSEGSCRYSSENCAYGCKNNICIKCENVQESYTVKVPYDVQEPYMVQESYVVQEPYTVQEPYIVQEPYQVQEPYEVPYSYTLLSDSLEEKWSLSLGYYYECSATIFNNENIPGLFTVNFNLQTSNHGTMTESKSYNIPGKSSHVFSSIFDTNMGEKVSKTFSVSFPKKTEYKFVTKYHDVTKYRDVTIYRTVTKYNDEIRYRNVLVCDNQSQETTPYNPQPTPQPNPQPTPQPNLTPAPTPINPQPQLKSFGAYCNSNSECSSSYCVHNYCRNIATYCGDGYCDSGESCSSCSSDCGACLTPTPKITTEQEIYNFVSKIKGIENVKDGAKIAIHFDDCFASDYFVKKQNGKIIIENRYKGQNDYDFYLWIYCDYYKQIKDNSNICPLSIDKIEAYFNSKYCDNYCLFSKGYCALKSCMGNIEAFKSCP